MSMNSPTTVTSGEPSAGSKASEAAGAVQEHAGATMDSAKQEAGEVLRSAKEHARSVLDSTTDELRTQGRQQTDRMSSQLHSASDELRRMADASDRSSSLGGVVRSLSDSAQRAARRLDEGGPEGVLDDVRRMGREHPVRFLLMAAAGGFAAARLVRSTDTTAVKQAVTGEQGSTDRISGTGQGTLTGQRQLGEQPPTPPPSPTLSSDPLQRGPMSRDPLSSDPRWADPSGAPQRRTPGA